MHTASRLAATALAFAAALPLAPMARAEGEGLNFALSPYLWVAGISGKVTTPFQRVPDKSVEADFGDTLSNLSGFAFMGAAEVRYGRFGLLGDIMTLTVDADIKTPRDRLFSGGSGKVTTTNGTVLGLFRVVEAGPHALDLGAGVRPWSVTTKLTLHEGLLPGRTVKPTMSWTDPVLALRYATRISGNWGASFYGDVGGFGAGSQLTWQLLGTVDYNITNSTTMRLGYRHMQVEHRKAGTDLDIGLSGPIIAATFRF
jgi:opacity protein-like surface antigen